MAICMKHYIGVLVEKSLIKIYLDGKMTLHDLIEDVSKEIVRKKSSNDPVNCRKLWFPKDIVQLLEENGVNNIDTYGWFDFSSLTLNYLLYMPMSK